LTARENASAAALKTASRTAVSSPARSSLVRHAVESFLVLRLKIVSPSSSVCDGRIARAIPSCAAVAIAFACAFVSPMLVATTPIVVLSGCGSSSLVAEPVAASPAVAVGQPGPGAL
jgi:hypothetical protein